MYINENMEYNTTLGRANDLYPIDVKNCALKTGRVHIIRSGNSPIKVPGKLSLIYRFSSASARIWVRADGHYSLLMNFETGV